MREDRLKQMLVIDELLTAKAREVYDEHPDQWVFRPGGEHRNRLFFLWIDAHREIGGTRCRDDPEDRAEPWRWHAHLPKRFLRAMLDIAPPEEVAAAIAKTITA